MAYYLTPQSAELIRLVMSDLDLIQQQVAHKLNTSQGSISAWLTGRQGTSKENYNKLYELLGSDPRLTFLKDGADKKYFSSQKEGNWPYAPSAFFSPYFQKIEQIYQDTPTADGKIRIIRSLDALVLKLEQEVNKK